MLAEKVQFEIIFYCKDQQLSRDFYSYVLEQQPSLDVPGMTEFLLAENLKLGLMPENGIAKILGDKTPHPTEGQGIPRCELYLYSDCVEHIYARALKAGAREISPILPRDWGDAVGYVSDPDGHIIAVAKRIRETNS